MKETKAQTERRNWLTERGWIINDRRPAGAAADSQPFSDEERAVFDAVQRRLRHLEDSYRYLTKAVHWYLVLSNYIQSNYEEFPEGYQRSRFVEMQWAGFANLVVKFATHFGGYAEDQNIGVHISLKARDLCDALFAKKMNERKVRENFHALLNAAEPYILSALLSIRSRGRSH